MFHQKDRLRRDLRNNPRIFESVEKSLKDGIASCAKVSDRYNATYGKGDFNSGMLQAAMLDASVGGVRRRAEEGNRSVPLHLAVFAPLAQRRVVPQHPLKDGRD